MSIVYIHLLWHPINQRKDLHVSTPLVLLQISLLTLNFTLIVSVPQFKLWHEPLTRAYHGGRRTARSNGHQRQSGFAIGSDNFLLCIASFYEFSCWVLQLHFLLVIIFLLCFFFILFQIHDWLFIIVIMKYSKSLVYKLTNHEWNLRSTAPFLLGKKNHIHSVIQSFKILWKKKKKFSYDVLLGIEVPLSGEIPENFIVICVIDYEIFAVTWFQSWVWWFHGVWHWHY